MTRFELINKIIDDTTLTSTQKAILTCLWRFSDEHGISYPSVETILKGAGISNKRTFYTNRDILIERGYLQVESFNGRGCIYKITLGNNEQGTMSSSGNITRKQGQYRTTNRNRTELEQNNYNNMVPLVAKLNHDEYQYFYGGGWMTEFSSDFIC